MYKICVDLLARPLSKESMGKAFAFDSSEALEEQ